MSVLQSCNTVHVPARCLPSWSSALFSGTREAHIPPWQTLQRRARATLPRRGCESLRHRCPLPSSTSSPKAATRVERTLTQTPLLAGLPLEIPSDRHGLIRRTPRASSSALYKFINSWFNKPYHEKPSRPGSASKTSKCCYWENPAAPRKPSSRRTKAIGGIRSGKLSEGEGDSSRYCSSSSSTRISSTTSSTTECSSMLNHC